MICCLKRVRIVNLVHRRYRICSTCLPRLQLFQVKKDVPCRLIEGGYLSRDMYTHTVVCILYSASVASQVDDEFCFDSIVCGHHVYKTVWTPQIAGEIVSHQFRIARLPFRRSWNKMVLWLCESSQACQPLHPRKGVPGFTCTPFVCLI